MHRTDEQSWVRVFELKTLPLTEFELSNGLTDNDVSDSTTGLRKHGNASRPLVLAEAVSSSKSCRGYQPKDEASHMY
jgi:hypothetical protein